MSDTGFDRWLRTVAGGRRNVLNGAVGAALGAALGRLAPSAAEAKRPPRRKHPKRKRKPNHKPVKKTCKPGFVRIGGRCAHDCGPTCSGECTTTVNAAATFCSVGEPSCADLPTPCSSHADCRAGEVCGQAFGCGGRLPGRCFPIG